MHRLLRKSIRSEILALTLYLPTKYLQAGFAL